MVLNAAPTDVLAVGTEASRVGAVQAVSVITAVRQMKLAFVAGRMVSPMVGQQMDCFFCTNRRSLFLCHSFSIVLNMFYEDDRCYLFFIQSFSIVRIHFIISYIIKMSYYQENWSKYRYTHAKKRDLVICKAYDFNYSVCAPDNNDDYAEKDEAFIRS